jgi:hypothetical protein
LAPPFGSPSTSAPARSRGGELSLPSSTSR